MKKETNENVTPMGAAKGQPPAIDTSLKKLPSVPTPGFNVSSAFVSPAMNYSSIRPLKLIKEAQNEDEINNFENIVTKKDRKMTKNESELLGI